ncbi:MAG: segregation/condensation protein A [Verrucomicrobia subdivision 3 bacterium]|nr:segregation/condensation protein A [Limisphaerales bacterium]
MADYKVKFEVFEGPMDLLLYLVKKEEVDIYEVNLTKIAREFIEYVDLMREFDIEIAGEFLVMASTLVYIKSKELLPVDQQVIAEDDDEGEDPRWELIRKLVEYKKFKDAADKLETLEHRQEDIYPRLPAKQEFEMPEDRGPRVEVSIFDLINAVNDVIKRVEERNAEGREIFDEQFTVAEKITAIRERIHAEPSFNFAELFAEAASRNEVVATFLAMLELIRLRQIKITQGDAFGEIIITEGKGDNGLEATEPLTEFPETISE